MHSCVSIAAAASRGRDQQIGGSLRPRTAVGKSQLWAEPEMRGLAVGGESRLLNPAKILTVLTSLGADQSGNQHRGRCGARLWERGQPTAASGGAQAKTGSLW